MILSKQFCLFVGGLRARFTDTVFVWQQGRLGWKETNVICSMGSRKSFIGSNRQSNRQSPFGWSGALLAASFSKFIDDIEKLRLALDESVSLSRLVKSSHFQYTFSLQ